MVCKKSWLFASRMYICMGGMLGSSVQGHVFGALVCDNICWIPRCWPCRMYLCVRVRKRESASVNVCENKCTCVCVSVVCSYVLTGYFSRGSVSNASPNIDRQYSAILACCFGLGVITHKNKHRHTIMVSLLNVNIHVIRMLLLWLCGVIKRQN